MLHEDDLYCDDEDEDEEEEDEDEDFNREVERRIKMNRERNDMSIKNRAVNAIKTEGPATLWLLSAKKIIETTPTKVVKALVTANVIKPDQAAIANKWLATPLGSGVYGYAVGALLSVHPKAASVAWVSNVASYLRIEGGSRIAGIVIDPIFGVIEKCVNAILEKDESP